MLDFSSRIDTTKGHAHFKYPESRENDYTHKLQLTENLYIITHFTQC